MLRDVLAGSWHQKLGPAAALRRGGATGGCELRTRFAGESLAKCRGAPPPYPFRPRKDPRLGNEKPAAGLAALLALLVPELAPHAPTLVELGLGIIAVAAAITAMVRHEGNGRIGHDGG